MQILLNGAAEIVHMEDALDEMTLAVQRTLIVMESAKDSLLNRSYAASPQAARDYHDQVEAHLEVCTTYLRAALGELRAVEAPSEPPATKTA